PHAYAHPLLFSSLLFFSSIHHTHPTLKQLSNPNSILNLNIELFPSPPKISSHTYQRCLATDTICVSGSPSPLPPRRHAVRPARNPRLPLAAESPRPTSTRSSRARWRASRRWRSPRTPRSSRVCASTTCLAARSAPHAAWWS
ncbi:hypothetical protein BZA05DRAFT_473815, partial [Tricharina praecox]|uniref:uncharacterized protein n=1 Tax=Tricharina praecox TaxID=43433 RepID=UPI00221F171B